MEVTHRVGSAEAIDEQDGAFDILGILDQVGRVGKPVEERSRGDHPPPGEEEHQIVRFVRSPDSGYDKPVHPELCALAEASRHAITKPSISSKKRFASPFSSPVAEGKGRIFYVDSVFVSS